MKTHLSAIALLVGIALLSFTNPTRDQEIRDQLVETLRIVNDKATASNREAVEFSYTQKTVFSLYSDQMSQTSAMKVIKSAEAVVYQGTDFDFYQDANHTLAIVHPRKLIYASGSYVRNDWKAQVDLLSSIKEDLIHKSEVIRVQEFKLGDTDWTKVSLLLPEQVQRSHKLKQMDFVFSAERKELKSSSLHYTSKSEVSFMEVEITKLIKSKDIKIQTPVTEYVYTSGGNLRKQYRDYNIINSQSETE